MEEIHKNHDVVCDATQTQDDDTLTQGTAASRMSLSTIFTAGASTLGDDVTISQEDVYAFNRGLIQKRHLLSENLKSAKERHRSAEDEMQKKISDIQAKLSGVESNKKRIDDSKREALRELETVKSQMSSTYTRVRESDVADAKKQAANLAKSRDNCNNDPRREQIQQEHKVLEDKLKSLSDRYEAFHFFCLLLRNLIFTNQIHNTLFILSELNKTQKSETNFDHKLRLNPKLTCLPSKQGKSMTASPTKFVKTRDCFLRMVRLLGSTKRTQYNPFKSSRVAFVKSMTTPRGTLTDVTRLSRICSPKW